MNRTSITLFVALFAADHSLAETLQVPTSFATIQSAVDAASPGDAIEVGDGVFRETILVITPNITLRAKGAIVDSEYQGPGIEVSADDVRIEGFILVNGAVGISVTGARATITGNEISGTIGDGIAVDADDATITGTVLTAIGGDGIDVGAGDQSTTLVQNNEFDLCVNAAIEVSGGRMEIRKNRCYMTQDGIEANPSHPTEPSLIVKNDILFAENDAIDVFVSEAAGVTVKKNKVRYSGDTGIEYDGPSAILAQNEVDASEDTGISVSGDGARIEKNKVRNAGRNGLAYSADVAGQAVIADNNVKRSTLDGVFVFGDQVEITGNVSKRNAGDGIDVQSGDGNRIQGNRTIDNGHEGIDNSGTNTRIDDNEANGNGAPIGPDIAGTGNGGIGSVVSFTGNVFVEGGETTPQRLDPSTPEP